MRTITLEEHFLTKEAIKATDHLRDSGLALSYHEPGLTEKLLNIGAGRVADMDASGIDLQVLSLAVCGVEELESAQAVAIAHDTNEQLRRRSRVSDSICRLRHSRSAGSRESGRGIRILRQKARL